MKINIDKILFGLYFLLAFFTPIIYTSFTAELYEFPKMYFVYIIGSLILFLFILERIIHKKKNLVLPNTFVCLFIITQIISTFFSTHLYTSIWGYYSRFNEGLISILIFFGLYIVGINYFDKDKIEKIITTCLLTLIPISIYGISQSDTTSRIYSTFGQPNWLSAYLVFLMPILINKIIKAKILFIKTAWVILFIVTFICLWSTHSISGILGFLASGIFLAIHFRKKLFNKWGIAITVILLGFIAFNGAYIKNRISDAFTFSADPKSYKISDPGLIRAGLWKGTLNLIFANPKNFIMGIGLETFPYQYPFYRQEILNYSSEWDFIMNKPHNYYLEMAAESGIFSLIIYLVILFKTLRIKNKFVTAGLAGFYMTNLFGWPTVYTSFLFWFFLIFITRKDISQ